MYFPGSQFLQFSGLGFVTLGLSLRIDLFVYLLYVCMLCVLVSHCIVVVLL